MPEEYYIDATFDKYTKVAFIGYCNSSMTIKGVSRITATDINQAELAALCLAIRAIGPDSVFFTDSQYVVENCMSHNVQYIKRDLNIADTLVSAHKENFFLY